MVTTKKHQTITVIEYVLSRLHDIGVRHIFGVPGDYSFPVDDAICNDPRLQHIGTCNELNAAYAADGYARINGVGALSTTYGVGELSAINGVAGSYAEYLPVFHLVGMPPMNLQEAHSIVHHTLGNGEFDLYYQMVDPVVCAKAIFTPENCVQETERLIAAALYHRRPVYMAFPADYANMPVSRQVGQLLAKPESDPVALRAAVTAIINKLDSAKQACILPGIIISRCGLCKQATAFVEAANLPFATMLMDKGVLEETHPNYLGMYDGKLMSEEVRAFVEDSDCLINIGALFTDISTGAFTASIDPASTISINHHNVQIADASYHHVEMQDVLTTLSDQLKNKPYRSPSGKPEVEANKMKANKGKYKGKVKEKAEDKISAEYLYQRFQQMLKADDILFIDTGTVAMAMGFSRLPKGTIYQNQNLWGSIGWATPAAFGAAIAAPHRRLILFTGEGAHQVTAQEISQFHRQGLKPIIFVVNNDGYLTERIMCTQPEVSYNNLAQWQYHKLPDALGCGDWFIARVTSCGELDIAIKEAEAYDAAAYIEVVTGRYVMPPLAQRINDSVGVFY